MAPSIPEDKHDGTTQFSSTLSSSLVEPLLPTQTIGVTESLSLCDKAPPSQPCSAPPTSEHDNVEEENSSSNSSNLNSSQRNVRLILGYTFFVFAGRSIWNQNVLANYAFLLMDGDPKAVGYMTAAMGISQLLVSFPAGFLADKYRRDTLLRFSSLIGVAAVAISLLALHAENYFGLIVSLCVWGCYWGCAQTALTALFADSIPDGKRSHYFTTRSILIKFGQLTGPTVALAMFVFLGDHWRIEQCAKVMAVGQLICLPAVFLLCLMKDDTDPTNEDSANSNDSQQSDLEEPLLSSSTMTLSTRNNESSSHDEMDECSEDSALTTESSDNDDAADDDHQDETYDAERLHEFLPFLSQESVIPTLVATADVTAGLASGMSIRYFAIFLADNLKVGPVMVQCLYIIAPLVQVVLMKWVQILAKRMGRCFMAVMFKWIGIILMLVMVLSYTRGPVWLTCTILIFRTAFMNSPSALTRSVLMDHVKKEDRAKWSALESLNMFSWSGSAALGGLLVDKEGIIFNFCTTAGLQFLATMPIFFLSFFSKRN